MKWLSYLLALYIILLSGVPCCSFNGCPEDKTGHAANQENEKDNCGNYSPFFSCEGCAVATIAWEPMLFEIPAVNKSPVYTSYIQLSLPQVHYEFWQPPKLG